MEELAANFTRAMEQLKCQGDGLTAEAKKLEAENQAARAEAAEAAARCSELEAEIARLVARNGQLEEQVRSLQQQSETGVDEDTHTARLRNPQHAAGASGGEEPPSGDAKGTAQFTNDVSREGNGLSAPTGDAAASNVSCQRVHIEDIPSDAAAAARASLDHAYSPTHATIRLSLAVAPKDQTDVWARLISDTLAFERVRAEVRVEVRTDEAIVAVDATHDPHQQFEQCIQRLKRWCRACEMYVDAAKNHQLNQLREDSLPALGFCWGGALTARALLILHNPVPKGTLKTDAPIKACLPAADQFSCKSLATFQDTALRMANAVVVELRREGKAVDEPKVIRVGELIARSAVDALPFVTHPSKESVTRVMLKTTFHSETQFNRTFEHRGGTTSLNNLLWKFIAHSRDPSLPPPILIHYLSPSSEGKSCLEKLVSDGMNVRWDRDPNHLTDMASGSAAKLKPIKGVATMSVDGETKTYDVVRLPCHPQKMAGKQRNAAQIALFYVIYKVETGCWPRNANDVALSLSRPTRNEDDRIAD